MSRHSPAMDDQTAHTLIKVLELKGLQSVMVKNINELAPFLTAQDSKALKKVF
jgi:hypothetical protein